MNIAQAARERIAATPALEAPLREGWNIVCDRIHEYASRQRPKMRVFEVHHLSETARKAFLASFVAGDPVADSITAALAVIKVTP